jgi:hypothetical protein
MGRRSRKRGETTRAERDAARRARAAEPAGAEPRRGRLPGDDRPQAPWGSFPLSELVVLLGIVLMAWGFLSGSEGRERVAAGLVIASLGGGELALREHLAGFRSHSALLAGVAAFGVTTVIAVTLGPVKLWLLTLIGLAVFGAAFHCLRELFKRRSGGLGFR